MKRMELWAQVNVYLRAAGKPEASYGEIRAASFDWDEAVCKDPKVVAEEVAGLRGEA